MQRPRSASFSFVSRQTRCFERWDSMQEPTPSLTPMTPGKGSWHNKASPEVWKTGKNQLQASKANRSWQRRPGDGSPLADDSLLQVGAWWTESTFRLRSGQKGLEAGMRFSSWTPSPTGAPSSDTATPARQPPRGRPRPGRASGNGEPGGRRAQKVAVRAGRGSRRPGPGPPRSPPPPAARLPVRSPPSWRRPCRRSAPPAPPVAPAAAAALGPPCRSRLGLASRARTACLLARSPARPFARFPVAAEAAAAHAHWLAGWREAAGCAAARALSLAGCTRSGEGGRAAERGQGVPRAGGRGERHHACALGAARREPREGRGEEAGRPSPNGLF